MVRAKDLMETDIGNTLEPELKATILRILVVLEKKIEDIRDTLTTEMKKLITNQAKNEKKNTMSKIKTECNDLKDGRNRGINK